MSVRNPIGSEVEYLQKRNRIRHGRRLIAFLCMTSGGEYRLGNRGLVFHRISVISPSAWSHYAAATSKQVPVTSHSTSVSIRRALARQSPADAPAEWSVGRPTGWSCPGGRWVVATPPHPAACCWSWRLTRQTSLEAGPDADAAGDDQRKSTVDVITHGTPRPGVLLTLAACGKTTSRRLLLLLAVMAWPARPAS